ncbi:hypothetical protein VTN00DRAFT_4746 [Thermoascus crustaceus]|uniref:uncharacterized protein n=1 Tax=Thermoascus crustaceus TaxID=5088 RepID=UPI0037438782
MPGSGLDIRGVRHNTRTSSDPCAWTLGSTVGAEWPLLCTSGRLTKVRAGANVRARLIQRFWQAAVQIRSMHSENSVWRGRERTDLGVMQLIPWGTVNRLHAGRSGEVQYFVRRQEPGNGGPPRRRNDPPSDSCAAPRAASGLRCSDPPILASNLNPRTSSCPPPLLLPPLRISHLLPPPVDDELFVLHRADDSHPSRALPPPQNVKMSSPRRAHTYGSTSDIPSPSPYSYAPPYFVFVTAQRT